MQKEVTFAAIKQLVGQRYNRKGGFTVKINVLRSSKLVPLILGLAMALVMPLAVARPASAAWACASNYVCLYEDAMFGGAVLNYGYPSPGCYNVGAQFNDEISSIRNYRSRSIIIHEHVNCSGWAVRMFAGEAWGGLSAYAMNDRISSITVE